MLLNMYYKLLWWWAVCAANAATYTIIPLTYFADGKAYDRVYWIKNVSNSSGTALQQLMFSKPNCEMRSQTSTPISGQLDNTSTYGYMPANFVVGSGTTSVMPDDYRLENEIIGGITCEAISVNVEEDTHTVAFRKTIYNGSDGDITISEVGLTCPVYTSSNPVQALIYREVLENPVTMAPGESATLRIAISHEYPI